MSRLVPPNCVMRPSQIQDLRQIAVLDRQLAAQRGGDRAGRWRNLAALAFFGFSLFVALKDWKLLAMVMLGFAPIYLILGWFGWLARHPPIGDWMDYWVVMVDGRKEQQQQLVAAAKWQHYPSYSQLESLYVLPKWRCTGIGSSLVERLMQQTRQPLYVISDRTMVSFYQRFGFMPIGWDDLPGNFPGNDFSVPELDQGRKFEVPMYLAARPFLSGRLGDFWDVVEQRLAAPVEELEP
jgi:GNAT superfamily N-acetyltransferase